MKRQILIIEDVGPTLNEFYSGMHWSARKRLADDWHLLTYAAVQQYGLERVEYYPVQVRCAAIFGPGRRRFDWENVAPTAKLIQDGLIQSGILRNDGPKDIWMGELVAKRGDKTRTIYVINERIP